MNFVFPNSIKNYNSATMHLFHSAVLMSRPVFCTQFSLNRTLQITYYAINSSVSCLELQCLALKFVSLFIATAHLIHHTKNILRT